MHGLLIAFVIVASSAIPPANDSNKIVKLDNIPAEKLVQLMKDGRVPVPDKVAYRSTDKTNIRLTGALDDIQKAEDAINRIDKTPRQVILKFVFGEEGVPPKPKVYASPICRALEFMDVTLKFDPGVRDAQFQLTIKCFAFPNPDGTSSIRADIQVGGHKVVVYLDKEDLLTFGGKDYSKGYRITSKNKVKKEIEAQHPLGNQSGLTVGFWPTLIEPDDYDTE